MQEKNQLLKTVAQNFVIADPPPAPLNGFSEVAAWFSKHEIIYPRTFTIDGNALGFKKPGADAVTSLANDLLKDNRQYLEGIEHGKLKEAIAQELINAIRSNSPYENFEYLELHIANWFSDQSAGKTHFTPCFISPNYSQPFSVGPVRFLSLDQFQAAHAISSKNDFEKFPYDKLFEFAERQNARWIAEVSIDGYDTKRSTEHADIAIDIALVALQLFIPSSECKNVARATARTIPSNISHFHRVDDHLRASFSRMDPCLAYSAGYFDYLLKQNKSVLDSVGNRVKAFVEGKSTLLQLDQAWCDAAYWFHEGISEELDSVAIAKIETSIEVLLFAESTKGCKDRLIKTFQSFYGLSMNDPLRENDPRTVFAFIESIVTARSRVLHGTWSTLNYRKQMQIERQHRDEIEMLARDLLARVTLELDNYKQSEQPEDNFTKFLDWVSRQRAADSIS